MLRRSKRETNDRDPQEAALVYCRSLTDVDWRRFKRAVDSYRRSDRILSGEDTDAEIGDISDELLPTDK